MSEISYYVAYADGINAIHNRAFRDYGACRDWIRAVKEHLDVDMKCIGAPITDIQDDMWRIIGPKLLEEKIPQKFQITSGKMRATDPCYTKRKDLGYPIENTMNGDWRFKLVWSDEGDWGIRVKELIVWNDSVLDAKSVDNVAFTEVKDFYVGVDSGQAGFFDEDKYPNGTDLDERFYNEIGRGTLSPRQVGLVSFGVVSSSGLGDGGYPLFVHRDENGKAIAAKIDYLPEGEEEDYADDEDETSLSE